MLLLLLSNSILEHFHVKRVPEQIVCVKTTDNPIFIPSISGPVFFKSVIRHSSIAKCLSAPLLLKICPIDLCFINRIEICIQIFLHFLIVTSQIEPLLQLREPVLHQSDWGSKEQPWSKQNEKEVDWNCWAKVGNDLSVRPEHIITPNVVCEENATPSQLGLESFGGSGRGCVA